MDSGPYVRPNDNIRDYGAIASKDTQQLREELSRLEVELNQFVSGSKNDARLDELRLAKREMEDLLVYKKKQAAGLNEEKEVITKTFDELSTSEDNREEKLHGLLAQLGREREWLEQRKRELDNELKSI